MGSELPVSTPQAAAGVYEVCLRRLNSAPLFIHNAAKPLGRKALEKAGIELRTNRTQQGAEHLGTLPALPATHPGRNPPTPTIRPAGALSAPEGTPTSGPLPAESGASLGARGRWSESLPHCSPLISGSPHPTDVPDGPWPCSRALVTSVPRPLDTGTMGTYPRSDQGSEGR